MPALRKGHGQGNTHSGVVGESGRCMGLGCERSGTCTVEVRSLHSWVEAVAEGCCGARKGSRNTVRRRGSVVDRSAAMMSDEQV